MTDEPSGPEVTAELEDLRARLAEAEEVLRAIRNGEVDAVVVTGKRGEQVYTLSGANRIYRQLIETMSEGAATLSSDGIILYCNVRLAEMLGRPLDQVLGTALRDHLPPADLQALAAILAQARTAASHREINLKSSEGRLVPVYLSASLLQSEGAETVLCLVLTDLTEQKRHDQMVADERLARLILEQTAEAIVVCGEQGRVIRASQAALRFCDGSPLLRPFAEVFPLRTDASEPFLLAPILQGETLQNVDVALDRQGQEFDLILNAGPLQSGQEILGCVVTLTDITERKRAEEALADERSLLRTLIDNLPNFVYVKDKGSRFLVANRAVASHMGAASPEVLLGKTDADFYPGDQPAEFRGYEEAILQSGVAMVDHDEPSTDAAGNQRWILTTKLPLRDARGKIVGLVGIGHDITERKRAADRLARINACLLDLGPDFDANVARLTTLCGELLGATYALYNRLEGAMLCSIGQWHTPPGYALQDKPEGHICYDVIRQGGDEALVVINLPQTPYAATDPNVAKYALKTYFGHVVRCAKEPVGSLCAVFQKDVEPTDDDKHILGIVALAIGSEEGRKHLEAQFRQAQKMEAVGRLAGGVAHDFNNMLQVILMNSEMALRKLAPEAPLHESLLEIHKAGKRSADLTRQLLAFARKQTIAPIVLDLNEIVASMLKMLGRLIGEDIDLLWEPAGHLGQVKMDPAQIDQILANLVVNARDAIVGVGKVTIETANAEFDDAYCEAHIGSVSGMYAMLAVSDDGCGMDKETQANIFEPFFTTKEMGKGTGLGLATVYGVVKQNNGFINVYSEPGQGTTFKIYLPGYAAEAPTAVAQRERAALPRGTETVLLVEDEPSVLRLAKRLLEHLGYKVLTAGSPSKAVQLAQEHAGDLHLVLTDVVMPEMSGRDLWGHLDALRPGLKCLFMSGYTANVIAHQGVLDEGVHFLEKPFSVEALAVKVRETLDA